MSSRGFRRPPLAIAVLVVVGLLVAIVAVAFWRSARALPVPGSSTYEEVTRGFYKGLAELQVGLLDDAGRDFERVAGLVPGEAASWGNLAIARLRLGDVDAAAAPVARALELAPTDVDIALLSARMEAARGQLDRAVAELRRAVALDPRHLKARYALAEELERAGSDDAAREALGLFDELQRLAPGNLTVVLERARLAATKGDTGRVQEAVAALEGPAASWPPPAVEQFQSLRRAAETGSLADAARGTAMLRNVLAPVPQYAADLNAVRTPPEIIADAFETFRALASPPSVPAPPDESLDYVAERIGDGGTVAAVFSLNGSDPPVVFTADRTMIRRLDTPRVTWPFPGGRDAAGTLLPLDWDGDFRTDLIAAGPGGVRLLLQRDGAMFEDATAVAAARSPVACGCVAAWAADIEMDGDLDVVLGTVSGPALVLRNNGDGTWTTRDMFGGVEQLRAFGWADLDRDGDPDAALLSGDRVRIFLNNRTGSFAEAASWRGVTGVNGLAVADVDGNGTFDLVLRSTDGMIRAASFDTRGTWNERTLAQPPSPAPRSDAAVPILAADLDNNGALDLVVGNRIALANERHEFRWSDTQVPGVVAASADLDQDGLLDLLGIGETTTRLRATAAKRYHWKQIRVRAQRSAGDQRINSFAVGGEIEVRAGLLRQKQVMTGAPAHFGLGTRTTIDVARIVWPNGVPQAEFGAAVDDTIVAEQRLKGSCPWVFAFDGRGMRFVTDFLWRSPLGLRINAQDTATSQTEDWVRIGGDQLAPRDGMYDVRITAELWETHFFDHVSLLAIDHPADTEAFIDERFSTQPASFSVQTLRDVQPVARALDQRGRDVTELVTRRDGRFLAAFDLGRYQGIAADHVVELEIEPSAMQGPDHRPLLIAHGWVYPTDSSINVAIAQGQHAPPRGLSLEYQQPNGEWAVADANLGFPAGKNKTMLIDLRRTQAARRLRLRTNLEVSWDLLASGVGSTADTVTTRVPLAHADLRYRGFSRTVSPAGTHPKPQSTHPSQPQASAGAICPAITPASVTFSSCSQGWTIATSS